MLRVKTPSRLLALLGGHYVDVVRHKGHLLAPAFGALHFQRFVLGDGFCTIKLLPAFLATILVGRHGLKSSTRTQRYNSQWGRCPAEGGAFKHLFDHIQRLVLPEGAQPLP